MAERPSGTIFLGPVIANPGRGTRQSGGAFWFLQGSTAVKLAYESKDRARQERRAILKAGNAHPVPNQKLFEAIRKALSEEQQKEPSKQAWGEG